ncbi:hypothetical protein TTHERM_00705090 (macronuclear) [Tetrahymena thermophila SB210]|uniref:Uncharacterized protein n=1 Tax=Tetrahymena thermophila (strain SB210) TaxID=312017 RepID=I7MHZ0_TETTS|nr:hypothetical protein TTHERM_00705090 [Tetrahymena thermophila SB210]EAR90693.1 hypothetical protein TTHERM_00705090 [Tetrahymena thermophila SB210]|eukprot:XP_001010938.1 hypothetical protein TTHERM_00705090 [Tetrahymena thermophila SB210]
MIQKSDIEGIICQDIIEQYQQEFDLLNDDSLLQEFNKLQKSNFLKNILRSFYVYILEEGDEIVIESIVQDSKKNINQIRKEFNAFTKNKKLNQATLLSFMKSKRFSKIFYYYLSYYSLDWIMKGSIQDVQTHVLCITHLKRCFHSEDLINSIRIYKKHI